ncbi:uncharacterized protein LOC109724963 isoform X1 [Ananas comosus]|uniref:Uncharacterized protein LOC109724963 isoform X1 n=1 Tax=Ananas comosus TaxID=4615 RepID=A0A6P5GLM2_ANACO|nr:uncharacterized protein LOC109724963 isoform X1 [Ananas comosus]
MLMLDTLIEALIFSEWYHCSQRIVSASAENNQPEGDMPCEYRRNCLYGERNPYVCGGILLDEFTTESPIDFFKCFCGCTDSSWVSEDAEKLFFTMIRSCLVTSAN